MSVLLPSSGDNIGMCSDIGENDPLRERERLQLLRSSVLPFRGCRSLTSVEDRLSVVLQLRDVGSRTFFNLRRLLMNSNLRLSVYSEGTLGMKPVMGLTSKRLLGRFGTVRRCKHHYNNVLLSIAYVKRR